MLAADSLYAGFADTVLGSLNALRDPSWCARLVWIASIAGESAILWADDALRLPTPNATSVVCDAQTCEWTHAVPDPTLTSGNIALCGTSGTVRRDVVRLNVDAMVCETIVEGPAIGDRARFSYVAIMTAP